MNVWRPDYPGQYPSLGPYVLQWMEENLARPDMSVYEPFRPTEEQARFIVRFYRVDTATGMRRAVRRAVMSRSKGAGKSPLMSAIGAAEALANVVPAGFGADGKPRGRSWSSVRTPLVQFAAVSEDQTKNAWVPLLEMLRDGPIADTAGLDVFDTFVVLPKGRIEPVTASAQSREGNRPVFCVLDQTESWTPSNGGVRLAATLRRNLGKVGGTSVECPNAYIPGENSVAEASAAFWSRIQAGTAKEAGLLYDHREAPPTTELADRESLLEGLAVAYGDSAVDAGGWVDLNRIAAECWDPDTDPQDARRYYLNQITHASDSWITQPEWAGCADATKVVADRDVIALGFDGSRGTTGSRVADATALIGCRVSDGHLFELGVWEEPAGPAGEHWEVPTTEVDAAVAHAFGKFQVVAFFADPARWESYIATWEAKYHRQLRVKASREHPVAWWMAGARSTNVVRALEQFHTAVVNGELSHDGAYALTRHVLNARRRSSRAGLQIAKVHPDSPLKIDAAVAAVLAWQARLAAVAAGIGRKSSAPGRIY